MSIYLITYDLMTPGKDYNKLFDAIKKLGSYFHCLDSTWLVDTNHEGVGIRDYLRQYIDWNDKLLVTALLGETAWYNLGNEGGNWLKSKLDRGVGVL
ncbi:MAG: SinR family protein [Planctomycetes bacterium]|nr:SinR family protein [Planctomycetota bacterium]